MGTSAYTYLSRSRISINSGSLVIVPEGSCRQAGKNPVGEGVWRSRVDNILVDSDQNCLKQAHKETHKPLCNGGQQPVATMSLVRVYRV